MLLARIQMQSQLLPELMLIAVIIIGVAITVGIALVWDKEPWWRSLPKPSKEYKNAKDQVKIWKIQRKYPEAFKDLPNNIMKAKNDSTSTNRRNVR
jgi:hypothetical protein